MAIANVGNRGTAVSGSSTLTISRVPTATVAVGRVLLCMVTINGSQNTNVYDAQDNYWKFAGSHLYSGGGARTDLWFCTLETALSTSDAVTVEFSSNVTHKSMVLWEFSIAAGAYLAVGDIVGVDGTGTNSGSAAITDLDSREYLFVRAMGKRANTTTAITATSGFTSMALTLRSANNTSAIAQRGEYRIQTATSSTSNPTFSVSGNSASVFAALYEYVPVNEYFWDGDGAVVLGGSAATSFRKTQWAYTPSGGGRVSGSAVSRIRYKSYNYPTAVAPLAVSGASVSEIRTAWPRYRGSGRMLVHGSAETLFVHPTTYYIDPIRGQDFNPGDSWDEPFRTFRPFADGSVALEPGDIIKMAKTPDPVYQADWSSVQLAQNVSPTTVLPGYSAPTNLIVAAFTSNITVIDTGAGISGQMWQTTSGYMNLDNGPIYYDQWLTTIRANGSLTGTTKLGYRTLPATLNLSNRQRIEIRLGGQQSVNHGYEGPANARIRLCLCSDTVGDVSLLDIPLTLGDAQAGVFAYEGALPDGVNSISFKVLDLSGTRYDYVFQSIIATRALDDPDYYGLCTLLRIGNHEGAHWTPIQNFFLSGASVAGRIAPCVVGPASVHGTTVPVYTRTAPGWNQKVGGTNFGAFTSANDFESYGLDTLLSTTSGIKPLFDLRGIAGTPLLPIRIIGGYNRLTDTVDGVTALTSRSAGGGSDTVPQVFVFKDTHSIEFRNIEVCSFLSPIWGMEGNNTKIRFENCTLSQIGNGYTLGRYRVAPAADSYLELYLKQCSGSIWVQDRTRESSGFDDGIDVRVTMEDCVLMPYFGWTFGKSNVYHVPCAETTVVGGLAVYCIAQRMATTADTNTAALPMFGQSPGATVTVYGGGQILLPLGKMGTPGGVPTLPSFYLQNSMLVFFNVPTAAYTAFRNRVSHIYGATIPSITMHGTTERWCPEVASSSSQYEITKLLTQFGEGWVPIRISSFTHSGPPANPFSTLPTVTIFDGGGDMCMEIASFTKNSLFSYRVAIFPSGTADRKSGVFGPGFRALRDADLGTITASAFDFPLVTGYPTGLIDVEDFHLENTLAGRRYHWGAGPLSAYFRVKDSTITNQEPSFVTAYVADSTQVSPQHQRQISTFQYNTLIYDNTNMVLQSDFVQETNGASLSEYGNDFFPTYVATTVMADAPQSHTVYTRDNRLARDYSVLYLGTPTWRSWNRFRALHPLSKAWPLGSVPLKEGKTVSIRLAVRRESVTDSFAGLLVQHYGCAGFTPASELKEKVALHTAGAGEWQIVEINFNVVRSGEIEIYFTHFGVQYAKAWFSDLRVIET